MSFAQVCTSFADPAEFRTALTPLIARYPERCTILNTVLHSQIAAPYSVGEPVMTAIVDTSGSIIAAALQTPPYPLTIVIDPSVANARSAAAALADSVRATAPSFDTISGQVDDVRVFARAWSGLTGSPDSSPVGNIGASQDHSQDQTVDGRFTGPVKSLLLHRLVAFTPPAGVLGSARSADEHSTSDEELINQWWYEFALEAGTVPRPSAPRLGVLALRAARGHDTVLWCVAGRPVAMAGVGAVVDGGVRIGPVYTPPGERGHGYGSAVTAAAVESAGRRGAKAVALFTDADYPTSNHIYRRLGFEPIDTFAELTVTPAG